MSKKVLISGITGSIGKSIAKTFIDSGYRVFGIGNTQSKITALLAELPIEKCLQLDLTQKFENKLSELPNDIDVLVNCAGIYSYKEIENSDYNTISRIVKLNLLASILLLCKYFVPGMKKNKWGRIINIGSISGAVGEAYASAYSASKAGLIGLTKSLALELAFDNITVNCINPGWVDSNMADENLSEKEKKETLDMIPQRRFIEPDEIANLCIYLASENAKGLTGQSINLCAGLSLG